MDKERVVRITVGTPVMAHIDRPKLIDEYLRYSYEYWQDGQYHKVRKEARMRLVSKGGAFLAGFVPRVKAYLEKRGYEVEVLVKYQEPTWELTQLGGIVYRDDQRRALEDILAARRGVYLAPTGSGKTLLIAGLVASVKTSALVLVHTASLFAQTVKELARWNARVGRIGGGEYAVETVTVAMRQTVASQIRDGKIDGKFGGVWGVIIVDEAHHCSTLSGDYATILKAVQARVRVGFTATLPNTEEGRMSMEGLLGPQIGKTSYEELERADVLAKPRIKFYRVPENPQLKLVRGTYQDVYQRVVVRNRRRNTLIVEKAVEQLERGRSVLVMVERVEHGDLLMELLEVKVPGSFVYLHGNTPDEIREEEKLAFEGKGRMGVVATRVWSEGVNIRSVDVVINAVGGESEIAAIQRMGRGMRATDTKKEVLLVDFIDLNHRYMSDHALKRICIYSEAGWL